MKMNDQKGFTMLEMMVVIVILLIIAGIAIPSFFKMRPNVTINGATSQIRGDLMWMRMRAISENNNYIVQFYQQTVNGVEKYKYSIYDDDDSNGTTNTSNLAKTVVINDLYPLVTYEYYNTINEVDNGTVMSDEITFTGDSITFQPNGRPTETNADKAIYLILSNDFETGEKGRMRAVSVSIAGSVKTWKYDSNAAKWD